MRRSGRSSPATAGIPAREGAASQSRAPGSVPAPARGMAPPALRRLRHGGPMTALQRATTIRLVQMLAGESKEEAARYLAFPKPCYQLAKIVITSRELPRWC